MKKLTKAQRRIEICKDAIAQLKIGSYKTGQFGYISLPSNLSSLRVEKANEEAQSFLCDFISPINSCGVCAKGSLLLSAVRKEDNLVLGRVTDDHNIVMKRLLEDKLFDELNLNLIEIYYEGWLLDYYETSSGWAVDCHGSLRGAGVGFGFENKAKQFVDTHNKKIKAAKKRYPAEKNSSRTKRLLWILNNMVKNQGVFKPI